MRSTEHEHTKMFFTCGYSMQDSKYKACFSGKESNYVIPCEQLTETVPFPGHVLSVGEVKDLITFLQEQVKEMESHE